MSGRVLSPDLLRELTAAKKTARRRDTRDRAEARRSCYRVTTEPVTVRLPFPPALNHYWRSWFVAGHVATYISSDGQKFRKEVIEAWRAVAVTFDGLLAVRVGAVLPDRRERDLDGLLKALLDSLEHAGAYRNDSQIRLLVIEHVATEAPGWVDVTIGPRPGERQNTLFGTAW
jgi:crossover junction endodeoxyribonuclease RusA